MTEFWNFKDFLVVPQHYWLWLLLAALIGLLSGWFACRRER